MWSKAYIEFGTVSLATFPIHVQENTICEWKNVSVYTREFRLRKKEYTNSAKNLIRYFCIYTSKVHAENRVLRDE